MTLIDLMTSKGPDLGLRLKALKKAGEHKPYDCYQCARCSSGCPSMKLLELKPHEVVGLVRMGFVEEVIESGMAWACASCLKCKERCPQDVAPADLMLALRNLAFEMGKEVPEAYTRILSEVMEFGFVQRPQEVLTKRLVRVNRERLGLPKMPEPSERFKSTFLRALEEL